MKMYSYKEFVDYEVIDFEKVNIKDILSDQKNEYYVVAIDDGFSNEGQTGLLELGKVKLQDFSKIKYLIKIKKVNNEA